ncbi:MAG: neuraminidase-like domain-containing protein, partial [Pseudonocardiaceae bacterium]
CFPDCEPCRLDDYRITFIGSESPADVIVALRRLAVFIRLWRSLRALPGSGYDFTELRDICEVLELFRADGSINPDFIRQLAAFQILRDDFGLALTDGSAPAPGTTGADRTHLLALWVGPSADAWGWAIDELLDQVQRHAQARHGCGCRPPEFLKLLAENLDPLSAVAGFDPGTAGDTWNSHPTHTLRFAEVLGKIYAADFGIGELLFLFTSDDHLDGEDPFPLQPQNEALGSPLGLPDDEIGFSLWELRRKLLDVDVSDSDASAWSWGRISNTLRAEFGFEPSNGSPDPLLVLGEHFFPSILTDGGYPVPVGNRQYRTGLPLADTSALMWNTPPDGPFRYDIAAEQLWTLLPLSDESVIAKLSRIRQLKPDEQTAVRELYFRPRADLAPFAFVFANFGEAEERLIQESDETKRWAYFQREFARCYVRSRVIAEHLAGHVSQWTQRSSDEGSGLAWALLRHLFADENRATSSWESDSGEPPVVTWPDRPSAGAFAALLGLTGTGLLGELSPEGGPTAWREVRGPMSAFGPEEDAANVQIPTVLPGLGLTLTHAQERFVGARNGFALANPDGQLLGGAQGYTARWSGVLLVDSA